MLAFSNIIVIRMRLALMLNTQAPQKGIWSLLDFTSDWNSKSSLGSFKILSPNPNARRRLEMLWHCDSSTWGLWGSKVQQAGVGPPKSIHTSSASRFSWMHCLVQWRKLAKCQILANLITGSIWTLIACQRVWQSSKKDRKKVNIK